MRIMKGLAIVQSSYSYHLRLKAQRGIALFLFTVLTVNICVPPFAAVAATIKTPDSVIKSIGDKQHAKPVDPAFTTKELIYLETVPKH
jgi:hypothetical protein